jgi:outer membrane protein OmpA-like peptidoglycan-associated protein
MQKRVTLLVLAIAAVVSCKKAEAPAPATSAPLPASAATATSATATAATTPANNADDLVGIAQGAMIVRNPDKASLHPAYMMLDESPIHDWVSAEGRTTNLAFVIELPERSTIDHVEFDTDSSELDTHAPKDLTVEMSDSSPDDGFKPIAKVTLQAKKDGQTFAADGSVAGRYVKLTVLTNYGGPVTQIGEFRAFGKRLTNTPMANITGAYDATNLFEKLNLTQNGTTVTGCYTNGVEPLDGGIEGHVLHFTYHTKDDKGPALMVISSDGKTIFGGYWKTNGVETNPPFTAFDGKRTSDKPEACPGAKPEEVMSKALTEEKRLRLYGINFDSDSDHLRDESKPTLDLVVAVLKAHADWKLTIEGHTDLTSTPEHNQTLSDGRANAVKTYLVSAGIDGSKLTTKGLGATQPVASNDTALGRAANRRVELVRE